VRGGFAYDDREVLFGNPVVAGDLPLWSVIDRDYWHHIGDAGHWRPSATLALRLDQQLYGAGSRGYHATNVLLHALVVAAASVIAARLALLNAARFPWFGLAWFATHPLLADSVAWISGRTSMLSALGGLAGALLMIAGRPHSARVGVAAGLGVLLALCGKEDGLVFALVLPLLACGTADDARRRRVHTLAALIGSAVAVALWLALRAWALGAALPSAPHALLAHTSFAARLAVGLAAWGEGLAALFVPWPFLPPNLTPADVRGAHGEGLAPRLLFGAACLFGALAVALRGRGRARSICTDGASETAGDHSSVARDGRALQPRRGSWTGAERLALGSAFAAFAAIVPLLQIVPSGELFAPRFWYLPLLLGAPALSGFVRKLVPTLRLRRWLIGCALVACVIAAPFHARRYSGLAEFWRAHLPRHGADPRVWNELGRAARAAGDLEGAARSLLRATALDPGYSRAWGNLGVLAMARGDTALALEHFERAARVGRANPIAHANLGSALLREGRAREAVAAYTVAVELAPGRAASHRGLARARAAEGDLSAALDAAQRALALAPQDPATLALVAELEGRQRGPQAAEGRDDPPR